jgi:hypothetical protein
MRTYQENAIERREHQRILDEENKNWWERKRKADYMMRRRSEPFIKISSLEMEE